MSGHPSDIESKASFVNLPHSDRDNLQQYCKIEGIRKQLKEERIMIDRSNKKII